MPKAKPTVSIGYNEALELINERHKQLLALSGVLASQVAAMRSVADDVKGTERGFIGLLEIIEDHSAKLELLLIGGTDKPITVVDSLDD